MIINKQDSFLLVIDLQEKLVPHISGINEIILNSKKLIKTFKILDIPIVVTEQEKLGSTINEIKILFNNKFSPIRKASFSCFLEEEFKRKLEEIKRKTCIISGIEAHICVEQTALDLLNMGYNVHVVADAIGSRKEKDKEIALQKLCRCGVLPTTTEMVMYELIKTATSKKFKEILKLVKNEG